MALAIPAGDAPVGGVLAVVANEVVPIRCVLALQELGPANDFIGPDSRRQLHSPPLAARVLDLPRRSARSQEFCKGCPPEGRLMLAGDPVAKLEDQLVSDVHGVVFVHVERWPPDGQVITPLEVVLASHIQEGTDGV